PELLEPEGPRHPLWGVAAALAEGDAFFSPCDLLGLKVEQVRALVGARSIARGQPLLGVIPARLRERAFEAAIAGTSVRAFTAELRVLDVGPIANLNRVP